MKVSDIESVACVVLPKVYSSDLHPESWRVFASCRKRCVLTANPRIMVEAFLKDFLGADMVLGTEIGTYRANCIQENMPLMLNSEPVEKDSNDVAIDVREDVPTSPPVTTCNSFLLSFVSAELLHVWTQLQKIVQTR
ncbi:hypothetical protein REPUB_Repub01dG0106800 [Reevesia pubescens]